MSLVCAIIPALNEETTVASVVRAAKNASLIDDVWVVSDGSTDKTAACAKEAGAQVVVHATPQGKAQAMQAGVEASGADVLVFLDADLIGLTSAHVDALASAVCRGEVMMHVGLRDRGAFLTELTRVLPLIAGERALTRRAWMAVPTSLKQGYMIEIALNQTVRHLGGSIRRTALAGLTFRRKHQKVSLLRAGQGYVKMWMDIFRAYVLFPLTRKP